MNRCGRFEEMMPAYVEGSIGPVDKAALEQHLAGCPSCRAMLEDVRRVEEASAVLRGVAAGEEQAAGLEEAVLARARDIRPRGPAAAWSVRRIFSRRWTRPAAAAAAALILAVVLWPGLRGGDGITWAAVEQNLGGKTWVHFVDKDKTTRRILVERWYDTAGRRVYMKGDLASQSYPVLTDLALMESWEYAASEKTLTLRFAPLGDYGNFYLEILNPDLHPQLGRSIAKQETTGGLTRFEVTFRPDRPKEQQGILNVWVDDKMGLPVRAERQASADGAQGEKHTSTTEIDYPETGPADVYALGVPHDVRIIDIRPSPEAPALIAEYEKRREAFTKNYRAVVRCDDEILWSYVFSRQKQKRRVEMFRPSVLFGMGDVYRRLRDPGVQPDIVYVYDGTTTAEFQPDRESTRERGSHMRGTDQDPAFVGWGPIVAGRGAPLVIRSSDPSLAGMIGLEYILDDPEGNRRLAAQLKIDEKELVPQRYRFWVNPQRDYLLHRQTVDEKRNGQYVPWLRKEILEYARLSTGHWYPKTWQISNPQRCVRHTAVIDENPTFADSVFDVDANPWGAARISATDAGGNSLTNVFITPVAVGWEVYGEPKETSRVVKMLPAGRPAEIILMDDSQGLVKKVSFTPKSGKEVKVEAVLEKGLPLKGAVKDQAGAPVSGVNVHLFLLQTGADIPVGWYVKGGKTDDKGQYEFDVLVPAQEYFVESSKGDLGSGRVSTRFDKAGGTFSADDIVLQPGKRYLSGRVTDKLTGQPLRGIKVEWSTNWAASAAKNGAPNRRIGGHVPPEPTDKDGRWRADPVSPGYVYNVFVEGIRYEAAAIDSVEPGREDVDFQLVPASDKIVPVEQGAAAAPVSP